MIRLDNRVAIVTGAGKGLGRAYALYLAQRGARVLVNNRRRTDSPERASADEVVEAIRMAGGEAVANYDSVEDPLAGERMVQQALDVWGRIDVLVNNAGVDQHCTFHKVSLDQFQIIMPLLHRPVARDQHMKACKGQRSGLTRTQLIKIDALPAIRVHRFFDNTDGFQRQGGIHQTVCGATQQLPAGVQNMGGNQ